MPLKMLSPIASAVDMAPVLAQLAEVKSLAEAADAKAVNARGMVLNDRTANAATLAPLQTAAAQLPLTQQQAAIEHAAFNDRITALEARPAPLKGDKGDAGSQGLTGPAGPQGAAGAATNLAIGARPVGALALNAQTVVTLVWSHPMPDTTYRVELSHSAVVALANVTLTVGAKTTTTCAVTVKASGLALVAGTLIGVAV